MVSRTNANNNIYLLKYTGTKYESFSTITVSAGSNQQVKSIDVNHANDKFVVAGTNNIPYLFTLEIDSQNNTIQEINTITIDTPPTSSVEAVKFSTNGNYLACGTNSSPYLNVYKIDGNYPNNTLTLLTLSSAPPAAVKNINWISDTEFFVLSDNMEKPFYYKIQGTNVIGDNSNNANTSTNNYLFSVTIP